MKAYVRNLIDNTTPETVIEIGEFEIRQYWTKGGIYGQQVVTVVFNYPDFFEHKTDGCGFCKMSDGLFHAFKHIGIKPKGMRLGRERISRNYHIGGNFYRVPKKDIRKV